MKFKFNCTKTSVVCTYAYAVMPVVGGHGGL